MEKITLLEQLNAKIDALLENLKASRQENTELKKALAEARQENEKKASHIKSLEERFQASENRMKELLGKLSGALEGGKGK